MATETNPTDRVLDGLLDQVQRLHSSPMVAFEVLSLLEDPKFRVEDVERCLQSDPALASSILRLVNSSCFGLAQQVSSLRQAITYIGTRSLRLSVLSFGLVGRLTRGTPGKVCRDYWRRALTMAVVSSHLCRRDRAIRPDEAYSAGLLADIGVLVLSQIHTDVYVALYDQFGHTDHLVAAEQREFGFDHGRVGSRLLSRWNLPKPLVRAAENHHGTHPESDPMELAVAAGDLMTDAMFTPETPRLAEAQEFLKTRFQIDTDDFISLAVDCREDILDNAEMFRVELEGTMDCEALEQRARRQYETEAMATALDFDAMTAVVRQDFS